MPRGALVLFAGAILLVVGVFVAGLAPSVGVGLVILGAVLLGAIFVYAGVQNWRTPGWTRVVNPGAAYREARAEREAVARRLPDPGAAEGNEGDDIQRGAERDDTQRGAAATRDRHLGS
jgi:hypothetical protein